MDNYNQRQIEIIKKKIDEFLQSKMNIGVLVNDLRALIEVLDGVEQKLRKKVYDEWFTLEQFYAASLDEDTEKYKREIEDSIRRLREIVS